MPDHDHNEFFDRRHPEYFADQMRERPSKKIEVKISLNQRSVSNELKTELKNFHNMNLRRSDSNSDLVIISGIPPDRDFGPQQVLQIVRRYAPNAVLN